MNFSRRLLDWYQIHKRDLPWRTTNDPYTIWVSEIIMQQTRIDQGLGYFNRFMERFPDVSALSSASEEDVLKVWKGLGYYSRARNMHLTARQVVDHMKGEFPYDYKTLTGLKGIGTYTAAAISSICAGEPNPVVDGNVVRVISRLYGIDDQVGSTLSQKKVLEKAKSLIDPENPGDFNQAMMEFGAIHCTPRNPVCHECIFRLECIAFQSNRVDELPVKKRETTRRERFLNYLCISVPGKGLMLNRRSGNDIWKNLWELPLHESDGLLTAEAMKQTSLWQSLQVEESDIIYKTLDFKHILTHQVIHARFFMVKAEKTMFHVPEDKNRIIDLPLVSGLPVSRLTERFLEQAGTEIG
ncbi:MAG: A/G-specific adenine glycosylase [Bacteroidales bacterium]|nr:A/G-specific adenine glycosylase [Bacteroidales bacterium]